MLTIQPPLIRDYFSGASQQPLPTPVFHRFFLSWEDALWHLLSVYHIVKGAKILVPEFFCGNVIDHMQDHGLEVVTYHVDAKLQPSRSDFISSLKRVRPMIVIIFHAVGIANPLMNNHGEWTQDLSKDCLLIEDCVHKIINHREIRFITPRHFLIDSLRKVVPIQGANLYSPVAIAPVLLGTRIKTLSYSMGVHWWWVVMQVFLLLAHYSRSTKGEKRYNQLAEWAMLQGYHLIGASRLPATGSAFMCWLARRIDVKRIEAAKVKQGQLYLDGVKPLLASGDFWLPSMETSDYKNLRGFPLIMNLAVANQFLAHLRNSGVLVRFELNISPWSMKQKIIYLPMGLHITNQDVHGVIARLKTFE